MTKEPTDAEFFEGRDAYFADPEGNYWEVAWGASENPVTAAARRAAGIAADVQPELAIPGMELRPMTSHAYATRDFAGYYESRNGRSSTRHSRTGPSHPDQKATSEHDPPRPQVLTARCARPRKSPTGSGSCRSSSRSGMP